jgi:hypothetical protein
VLIMTSAIDLLVPVLFFSSPLILIWGWVQYFNLPNANDWRSRASLVGLLAPLLSVAVWIAMLLTSSAKHWTTSSPSVKDLITAGMWIPLVGLVVALTGRPRMILTTVPPCIAAIMFWYGSTLP